MTGARLDPEDMLRKNHLIMSSVVVTSRSHEVPVVFIHHS